MLDKEIGVFFENNNKVEKKPILSQLIIYIVKEDFYSLKAT